MTAKRSLFPTLWLSLLFVGVLLFSFVYHLPASWALQQMPAQMKRQLDISNVQGSVWNGRLLLGVRQADQSAALGTLSWKLSPLALLGMSVDADMRLDQPQGGGSLVWELSTGLLSQQTIKLAGLDGQWDMQSLQALLPPAVAGLGELKGRLQVEQLNVDWDTRQRWVTQLSGEVKVAQLDVMGALIPELTLKPNLKGKQVAIEVQGGDQNWHLTGASLLNAKSFQHSFRIKADSADKMPPWADLVMRKKTPVLASFNQKGRW